ncbi:hypothetical protein AZE42_13134 [Rhizopogon vesiculosus]|uniref:Uncharacterized protein n=1 Tax=Rhizopogon vesiculosus TaxID=180088 RepID=A0A1J8R4L8_9AGAM|nr:hypothetical protein AZE42_13134 [Rhizopogon vesiculosus]
MVPHPTAKIHRARAQLTTAQKAQQRLRREELASDIDNAKHSYEVEAAEMAQKHGRSLKWTRNQLFLRSRLAKGDRTKLTVFIAQNKARLLRDYKRLTTAEKQVYNARILEARQAKSHTARANPKATKHDVNAVFTSMDREWMALHARTGIEGFYVAVRGGIEDLAEPKIFFTEKAQKFVRDVLGIEPQHLGLKLEAFVISRLDERVSLNRQRPLNKLISECRELIQDELEFILMEKGMSGKVKMNYTNYERAIVERYGVVLNNWPLLGTVKNPSKVGGRGQVQILLNGLKSDTCKWISLSESEIDKRREENQARQAHGEQVYIPRKARARMSQHTSKETIDTEDESSASSSSSDEE